MYLRHCEIVHHTLHEKRVVSPSDLYGDSLKLVGAQNTVDFIGRISWTI